MTTVLCCHNPTQRIQERAPAILALATLAETVDIRAIKCLNPNDYGEAVLSVWGNAGDLVIIEHDMEVRESHIKELLACSESLCMWAYWLSGITTGIAVPVVAAGFYADSKRVLQTWAQPGDTWVDHAGLGCVKIAESKRRVMPNVVDWSHVCTEVNRVAAAPGDQWHVHWPTIPHHHGFRRQRELTHA